MQTIKKILEMHAAAEDKNAFVSQVREALHSVSETKSQPIDLVRWVPISMVSPNDYNPNSVAKAEMQLLYTSILHDGYTQPIVTIKDEAADKYVIVDGFHRYYTALTHPDILKRNHGLLPVVVISSSINDRMASTVRHNRARGKHAVNGMANMVFQMLENGWDDAGICNELGLEVEEITRLKHITGFSRLFESTEYKRAWITKNQARIKAEFKATGRVGHLKEVKKGQA